MNAINKETFFADLHLNLCAPERIYDFAKFVEGQPSAEFLEHINEHQGCAECNQAIELAFERSRELALLIAGMITATEMSPGSASA